MLELELSPGTRIISQGKTGFPAAGMKRPAAARKTLAIALLALIKLIWIITDLSFQLYCHSRVEGSYELEDKL